jgi:hypothetical protein
LARIIAALDVANATGVEVIPLKNASNILFFYAYKYATATAKIK